MNVSYLGTDITTTGWYRYTTRPDPDRRQKIEDVADKRQIKAFVAKSISPIITEDVAIKSNFKDIVNKKLKEIEVTGTKSLFDIIKGKISGPVTGIIEKLPIQLKAEKERIVKEEQEYLTPIKQQVALEESKKKQSNMILLITALATGATLLFTGE